MRTTRLLAALALTLTALSGCVSAEPNPDGPYPHVADYAREIAEETNKVRIARGLEPLEWSDCAADAGEQRAVDLIGRGLHHAPLNHVIDACSTEGVASENLVDSQATPTDVIDAWLGSPGHANNILDPQVTAIGVGCVPNTERVLCSQIFIA